MKFILLALSLFVLHAPAYTLKEILELQKKDTKTASALAYKDASEAQNLLQNSYDAPWINAGVAYSKEGENRGGEFTLSLSQTLTNPFDFHKKESLQQSLEGALKSEFALRLNQRELDIAQKYYAVCLSKKRVVHAKALQEKQHKKIAALENSYALGEISKKELLFSRLDLSKLAQQRYSYERSYYELLALLEESLPDLEIERLSCQDLIPPKAYTKGSKKRHHKGLETLEYKKVAALKSYELYDSLIPQMQYQLLYEKELSMERITLGVAIPLTPLTQQQELLKLEQLKKNVALSHELEAMRASIQKSADTKEQLLQTLYE